MFEDRYMKGMSQDEFFEKLTSAEKCKLINEKLPDPECILFHFHYDYPENCEFSLADFDIDPSQEVPYEEYENEICIYEMFPSLHYFKPDLLLDYTQPALEGYSKLHGSFKSLSEAEIKLNIEGYELEDITGQFAEKKFIGKKCIKAFKLRKFQA